MRVAVLGAGLQGTSVAMELASTGIRVDLYDRNDRCMSQASAQNEGKIHLGYVYANDRTLRTARAMVKGAVSFAPLLRTWIGESIDAIPVSTPFHYVVHTGSLLRIDELEHHFRCTQAMILEESHTIPTDYFGADYRLPPIRMSENECSALYDRRRVAAAYRTAELGIDPEALAAAVRARVSTDPAITCCLQTFVHGVAQDADGVTVDFEVGGRRESARYDHVVNALWDGRLAVDRTLGLRPDRPWLYRVKHYVRLHAPTVATTLPSVTIVLGPFGDIVAYGNDCVYLSWYPAGMRGSSSDLSPPAWPLTLGDQESIAMRGAILDGLRSVVPAVDRLTADAVDCCEIKAGIIFAWGATDIQDASSGLHQRHAIGPRSCGRYHSVDTGKLTMAPFFAKVVADRIREMG